MAVRARESGDSTLEQGTRVEETSSAAPKADAHAGGAPAAQDVKPVDAGSSPQPASDVKSQPETSAGEGVKPKESAPATLQDKLREGLQSMAKKAQSADAPSGDKKQQDSQNDPTKPKAQENQDDPDDPSSDEEKTAPADLMKHPAVKQIRDERKQARRERNQALKKLEVAERAAGQYRQIQGFLKQNKVSDKDAADALKLTALIYSNPQAGYQKLVELAQNIGQQFGFVLPPDLQKDVAEGRMTQERATQLAKTQGEARLHEHRAAESESRAQAADNQAEMQLRTQLFERWAGQVSKTDVDLQKKLPLIVDRLSQILMAEGDPGSVEAAWERLNRAHREVNERIQGFQPQRQPVQPSPASAGAPRAAAVVAPRNYEEAKQSAFNNIRASRAGR